MTVLHQDGCRQPFAAPLALETDGRASFRVARRNKMQFALATIDPRVAEIERGRKARGLSHNQLIQKAGVHPSTWYYLRCGEQAAQPRTLARLQAALAVAPVLPKAPPAPPVKALIHAIAAVIVGMIGDDLALMAAINPKKFGKASVALQPRRIRTVAVYVAAVELEIENTAIARALGCSRANIRQVRDDIEAVRHEGGAVDRLIARVAATLRGEGP